ncbi:MAG: PTS galactitol transporter subunit IIC [Erysipelotrichaceae bacterium]|nr:PTS galactitol transporter subunit IIC [Erysipelotrichaceae bacterium]
MSFLFNTVQGIINLGAAVFLPIALCVLGVIFKMNFWKAMKSGLLVGIGFTGLNAVVGILINTITPVTDYYAATGSGFTIVDAGWPTLAGAAWATPFAAIIIPVCLVLNILLIRVKFTRTLNVDIWDYWHFMFSGAMVYYLLISHGVNAGLAYIIGLVISLGLSIFALKIADIMGPKWRDYFGLEGTSAPHQAGQTIWLIALVVEKIVEKIPGINKINISMDTFAKKLGGFGDSTILGFVAGVLLALLTRQSFPVILSTGVGIASSMVLMPRMVSLLMEGITPIGKAATSFIKSKMGEDTEIEMGMDIALGLGDSTAITASIIMIPITVGIALVFPGNKFFPLGTLPTLVYYTAMCALAANGDLFKTVITTSIYMVYLVFAMNFLAVPATAVIAASKFVEVGNNLMVGTSLEAIPNLITGIIAKILGWF